MRRARVTGPVTGGRSMCDCGNPSHRAKAGLASGYNQPRIL